MLGDGAAVVGLCFGQVAFLKVQICQYKVEGSAGARLDLRLELLNGGFRAGLDQVDESAQCLFLFFGDRRLVAGKKTVGAEEFLNKDGIIPKVGGGCLCEEVADGQAEAE